MSTQQISELINLDIEQSELAKSRQYDDPIHFLANNEQQNAFIELLTYLGYEMLIGGRFICQKSES